MRETYENYVRRTLEAPDISDDEARRILWEETPFPLVAESGSLAPYLARVRVVRELQQQADVIERELICCDVFERRDTKSSHKICYWAGASRQILLDRIEELRGNGQQEEAEAGRVRLG